MTLIECFTDAHIDNICACLRLRPEKMIMVGNADEMNESVERYRQLLKQRRQHTEISLCNIRGMDLEEICATLDRLVKQQDDCVIDLTGGDELVIMAVGAMLAGLDPSIQKRIRIEKTIGDTVVDCCHDNCVLPYKSVALTIEELIALHGGILHPDSYQPPRSCTHRDLAGLWSVVAEDPKAWNRQVMFLCEFESKSDSKMQVYLPLASLRNSISNFTFKENAVRDLLDKLHRCGVIDDRSSRYALEYTYTDPMLRYCTLKAGNVLEVKTLLEGRSVLENGAPFFQDCRMSVGIDWDGIVHDPRDHIAETRNEIDVVLMHGTTPLFISCKNGNVDEDELYKLNTVAHRFGGTQAKKMLIATDLDLKNPAANRSFIRRAWDMDIFLMTDAADLSREEWRTLFRQAMLQ